MDAISPVQQSSTATSQSNIQAAVTELGSDVFLRLLVTQLQSQDPTKPVENEGFIAQLAQFTTLEQTTNSNKLLQELVGQNTQRSQFELLNLLGHSIVTSGNTIGLGTSGEAKLSYALSQNANVVNIEVLGPNGQVLRTLNPGVAQAIGGHDMLWDGKNKDGDVLPPGVYEFRVKAEDANNKTVPTLTFARETVANIVPGTDKPVVVQSGKTYTAEDIISIE
ncbi:MAG: flagellar hook assembly protein FlgD [Nitrospirales bacterium]